MISEKTRAQLEALAPKYGAAVVSQPDSDGKVDGGQLRSIELTKVEQELMLRQVTELAETGGGKNAKGAFDHFKTWVHRNGPFDVIIDGANVGFANQRPDKGAARKLIRAHTAHALVCA